MVSGQKLTGGPRFSRMPRVPFVGRLHLYLSPFRQRPSEEFTTPEESPIGCDFTPKSHDVDPGQSSEGGSQAPAYSRARA